MKITTSGDDPMTFQAAFVYGSNDEVIDGVHGPRDGRGQPAMSSGERTGLVLAVVTSTGKALRFFGGLAYEPLGDLPVTAQPHEALGIGGAAGISALLADLSNACWSPKAPIFAGELPFLRWSAAGARVEDGVGTCVFHNQLSVVVALLLTCVIMPPFSRVLRPWLHAERVA